MAIKPTNIVILILLILVITGLMSVIYVSDRLGNKIARQIEEVSFSKEAESLRLEPKKRVALQNARSAIHQFMQPPYLWHAPAIKIVKIDLSYPCHSRDPDSDHFMVDVVQVWYYFQPTYVYYACDSIAWGKAP